jgi:hypothetical protein
MAFSSVIRALARSLFTLIIELLSFVCGDHGMKFDLDDLKIEMC